MNAAITSFTAPLAPQMPSPPPAAQQAARPGFAQVLSQTQSRSQQDAEAFGDDATAPQPAPPAAAKAASPERAKADKTRTDKPAQADATQGRDRAAGDKADAAANAAEDAAASEPAESSDDTTTTDPALADWLAALQLPAPPSQAPGWRKAGAAGDQGLSPGDDLADALPGKAAPGRDARFDPRGAERAAREQKGKPDALAFDAALSGSATAAVLAADEAAEGAQGLADLKPVDQPFHMATLVAPAQAAAAGRTADVAAPVAVQVATPATAPEFAQALGVQVSLLARDGVQQAELHLNPAEMGPISIQIALDGTQAQVNFGADSAATREIIENGLPELAASLREAGFTLSGGGVHGQARGRGDGEADGHGARGDGAGGGRTGSAPDETDVTTRRSLARMAAGGVDLYA